MKHLTTLLLFLSLIVLATSCKYYRQDVILQTETSRNWKVAKTTLESSYKINRGDWLEIQLFTNKGELILDPNSDYARQVAGTMMFQGGGSNISSGFSGSGSTGGGGASAGIGGSSENTSQKGKFQVYPDGYIILPMIGRVRVDSLTYPKVDSLLAAKFEPFYEERFVITRSAFRRIFYLTAIGGSTGGSGGGGGMSLGSSRVLPILHDNTHLLEVISMAGGMQAFSKASQVRIIRGDLKNPQVQIVNLQTIEGMMAADLMVQPNDIIYVEPGRRPIIEALKDFSPLISTVLGLSSLTLSTILAFRAFSSKY